MNHWLSRLNKEMGLTKAWLLDDAEVLRDNQIRWILVSRYPEVMKKIEGEPTVGRRQSSILEIEGRVSNLVVLPPACWVTLFW